MIKLDDPSTTKVGISSIKPRTAFTWTAISTVRLQKLLEKIQWYVIVISKNVRLTNRFHVVETKVQNFLGGEACPRTPLATPACLGWPFGLATALNKVHNFVILSTRCYLHGWFDMPDEFCLHSKHTKAMTITWIYSIERLPINDFKTIRLAFYPKQGNKIEGVVLNRVCIL